MGQFKPTDEQRKVIESDASQLILGGPGVGKTATALAAARQWILGDTQGTALFTSFSNAAVHRVALAANIELSGLEKRLRFKTFHSVAMEVISDFGRFVGLKRAATPLDETDESYLITERGWPQAKVPAHLKELAVQEGRVSFSLMLPLALSLISTSSTICRLLQRRYPLIVVDEFQDTDELQWRFLQFIGASSRVLAFGDPDQALYDADHHGVLLRVKSFEAWKGIKAIRFTGANQRCNYPAINNLASALLAGKVADSLCGEELKLIPSQVKQRRYKLAHIWSRSEKGRAQGRTIAFIAGSAKRAAALADELRTPPPGSVLPIPIFARTDARDAAKDAFRFVVYAAADYADQRTEDARKTLVVSLATFATQWGRDRNPATFKERVDKLMLETARSKFALRDILRNPPPADLNMFAEAVLTALESHPAFFAITRSVRRAGLPKVKGMIAGDGSRLEQYRKTKGVRGLDGRALSRGQPAVLSMSRCKGREFDYVVVIVDPRDHRHDASLDELRRLHYVAVTRAKRWLAVLYVPSRPGPVLAPVLEAAR